LERDAVDVAAVLAAGYTMPQVIKLAMERDPADPEEWAEAMDWFDRRMKDADLASYCSGHLTPGSVREAFAPWPRAVEDWKALLAAVTLGTAG
jgi:hypothetical protein